MRDRPNGLADWLIHFKQPIDRASSQPEPSDAPDVLVMGVSLGSGFSVKLANVQPVSRLMLMTPYDSMTEVAAKTMPYIAVRWIIKDRFESLRHVSRVQSPTTIVIAEDNTVIKPAHTKALAMYFKPRLRTSFTSLG